MATINAWVLSGFDDPVCSPTCWNDLLLKSGTNVVSLTHQWLRAWWETLGEGVLLLVASERGGELLTLAPLYATEGMVFFLGAGEADRHDFIGRTDDPDVLSAILTAAQQHCPDFLGFRLDCVPDRSTTGDCLRDAAARIGMVSLDEGELPTLEVDLVERPDVIREAVSRSMLNRENYCRRHGELRIQHLRDLPAIRPHLEEYYAQHLARWAAKGLPSEYGRPQIRAFLERFLELAEETGWIRFVRIDWKGRPFAFEFAWYYRGTHYSAPWCFAVEFANQSPGYVLLRHSMLAALNEGLETYDLGAGDHEWKRRLPVRMHMCHTWGIYPA